MTGFNGQNLRNIPERYLCTICSFILKDPVQLVECGHRMCKSCATLNTQRQTVICPTCKEESEVMRDRALEHEMRNLPILCSFCDWNGFLRDYENHLQQAHFNLSCEYCYEKFDSLHRLNLHKLNECDEIMVSCSLKHFGCLNPFPRMKTSNHYLSLDHQNAVMSFILRYISEMDVDTHFQTSTSTNVNTQLTEISETIDVLFGGLQALNEDVQRRGHETEHLQSLVDALSKDVATLKLSIDEQNTYLDTLKTSQEILTRDIASLREKVEDSTIVFNEGMYIWKLTNVAEKMADAQTERVTSIYSPPFYTSPTGYKIKARVHLNGYGNARGTHMSLFFVLMRSEYDAILKFPFNYKVTFCIYDQSGSQRHIIDSFRPDAKSNSFQRPRTEMNIAAGIQKFFPLAMLQEPNSSYIRNNTMFIKIQIDFIDMSDWLLAYALHLNPGLPIHVQQSMITQRMNSETQRHSSANRQLFFVCQICSAIIKAPAQLFCGHRPCYDWIIVENGEIVEKGPCVEHT